MKQFTVIFQPSGRRGKVSQGKTILEASRELGVNIASICGGTGLCGKCRVRTGKGPSAAKRAANTPPSVCRQVSPWQDKEGRFIRKQQRADGYRLACVARISGDVSIFVPEESRQAQQVVRKEAGKRSFGLKPAVTHRVVKVAPTTARNHSGDFERLKKSLARHHNLPASITIDYPALRKLPDALRQGKGSVTVAAWMEKEIIDVKPGTVKQKAYGLAVDIGTTTVVAHLCHLQSGSVAATETMMNPQIVYGEDVMSRISYCATHAGAHETLHRSIIEGLNGLVQALTNRCGIHAEDIFELAIVGNTVMHHLLIGIDPAYLGASPFVPAIHQSINIRARDLGLHVHPSANVHVLPIEAGFVGADNVGVLIAERPYRRKKMALIIDAGTNGELVLGNKEKLLCASCATGPALEGAHIAFGMRAAPSAIERVRIDPSTFEVTFTVIGPQGGSNRVKSPGAIGICGSGIIDATAELFRTGIIDATGRFRKDIPSRRFRINEGVPEFVIAWKRETAIGCDITITQQDVRNVQLAKGALYTGAKLMMRRLGIDRVDTVVLAGAFGSSINPEAAMIIGMFPDCALKNVRAVGNAAGDGARMALLNRDKRREAEQIASEVEYIELAAEKEFQKEFLDALYFPHRRDLFPHLTGILKQER